MEGEAYITVIVIMFPVVSHHLCWNLGISPLVKSFKKIKCLGVFKKNFAQHLLISDGHKLEIFIEKDGSVKIKLF